MICWCGTEATANGRECPTHFRERLASLTIGPGASETRTKTNYFDTQSLDETFGEDRVDRYWDETGGHGAMHRGPDGNFYHENYKGERLLATDKVLSTFVDGEESGDV